MRDDLITILTGASSSTEGLSDVIQALGALFGSDEVAWELGPYLDTDRIAFALSTANPPETFSRLALSLGLPFKTDAIVGLIGKPPRAADPYFIMHGSPDKPFEVDCIGWTYDITQESAWVDFALYTDTDLKDRAGDAACIFLQGELGELNLKDFVRETSIAYRPGNLHSPITTLRKSFAILVENCHYRDFFLRERWLSELAMQTLKKHRRAATATGEPGA